MMTRIMIMIMNNNDNIDKNNDNGNNVVVRLSNLGMVLTCKVVTLVSTIEMMAPNF